MTFYVFIRLQKMLKVIPLFLTAKLCSIAQVSNSILDRIWAHLGGNILNKFHDLSKEFWIATINLKKANPRPEPRTRGWKAHCDQCGHRKTFPETDILRNLKLGVKIIISLTYKFRLSSITYIRAKM